MATAIGSVRAEMSAGWSSFKSDMGKAKKAVQTNASGMQRAMNKVGKSFTGVTGSLKTFISVLAIGAAFRSIINATKQQEAAIAQLEQTLKSTGRYTPELSAKLQEYAGHLQGITTYGDEATIAMQSLLLTFTRIGGNEFNRAQMAVLDIATAMKTDLKTAAIQVGKALNDPVLGMTALSRSGIQFSDAQKEVVKQLVATGDVVGAQKIILKELETQFGGSAEAARNTLGGALKGLKNAFGDLFEGDSKGGGVKGTTAALNELTELLSDKQTVENAQILTNAMITGFGKVLTAISKTVEFTKWLGEELAAQVYGVAGDDIIRLTAKLEKAKDKLNELEAPYAKLSVFDKLLGKIGISKATLDYLRGIKSAREEVAKLQKQVDDFYAFEEAQKKKGAPAIPSVPSVSAEGTEGKLKTDKDSMDKLKKMMEEGKTLTASLRTEQEKYNDTLARLKILLDAGAISQDTYNRAIEKAGESLAEKQAQFQDDYKRATLSATEYELQQLQDLYVEREAYVEDKLKLDEWYWAEKKKILDKETDDASDAFNAMSEFGVQAAHNMQDAFSGFLYDVFDGQLKKAKDYFEEFAKTILRMSTNMMAQMAAQKMFGSMGQGGGDWGWVGSLASGAMGAWGGGKAEGGLVQPNTAYLVGEHGPELLQMGNQGGSIISNEGIQQTPQVNIRNINVLDPSIVGDYLSTHEGEQVIMNVVQRNQ